MADLEQRLAELEKKLTESFPEGDHHWHRRWHESALEDEKRAKNRWSVWGDKIVQTVIGTVVVAALGWIGKKFLDG